MTSITEPVKAPHPHELITDLHSALKTVAEIVQSDRTYRNQLDLVTPGVFVEMKITVSVNNDGEYKVTLRSATHGTTVNIARFTGLKGEAAA